MSLLGNLGVITSEITLSLYPILIKNIPTNFHTQLLSRFLVFSIGALIFYTGQKIDISKSLIYGCLTIFHVVVSYLAFSNLSAGTAMSLFYTYPIMNVIAGVLFLGEELSVYAIPFLILGSLGTYLISQEIPNEEVKGENLFKLPKDLAVWAGLFAAVSETLMFLVIRDTKTSNPIDSMLHLYPGALFIFGTYLLITKQIPTIDTNPINWRNMALFNLIIGFAGYCLRFYSINSVSTIVFSLLSFVGVISSYAFGKYFVNEAASLKTYIGAFLIASASSGVTLL